VKIDDLARQMILLHGLKPGHDIAVRYTGLRPGEKLFEEIFYAEEEVRPTGADGVFSAFETPPAWDRLNSALDELIAAAADRDEARTLALLAAMVPEFVRTP